MALPSPLAVGQKITAAFLNAVLTVLSQRPAAASGSLTLTTAALNTAVTAVVTFPAGRFGTTPAVTVSVGNGSSPQYFSCNAASSSTTGFTVVLVQTGGALGARIVNWVAVEST